MIFACLAWVFLLVSQGEVGFLSFENAVNWVCFNVLLRLKHCGVFFNHFQDNLFAYLFRICDMPCHERAQSLDSGFGQICSAELHIQLLHWIYARFLGKKAGFLGISNQKWRLRCFPSSEQRVCYGSWEELHMLHRTNRRCEPFAKSAAGCFSAASRWESTSRSSCMQYTVILSEFLLVLDETSTTKQRETTTSTVTICEYLMDSKRTFFSNVMHLIILMHTILCISQQLQLQSQKMKVRWQNAVTLC